MEQNLAIDLKMEKIDIKNKEMNEKLEILSQENSLMKNKLDEIIEGILELSTRP